MTSFCRLIVFDKRGSGLSDRDVGASTIEERMDDLRAALDAVGCKRTAVLGFSEGGPLAMLFAASYPERVRALVLWGTFPCGEYRRDDDRVRSVRRQAMGRRQDPAPYFAFFCTPARGHGVSAKVRALYEKA